MTVTGRIVGGLCGLIAAIAVLPGVSRADSATAAEPDQTSTSARGGAVYIQTNAPDENQILAYHRRDDGALEYIGAFDTGGRGSGGTIDPLQSQSSLLLSPDHRYLYATNAGSGDISVFSLLRGGWPALIEVQPSGGSDPVSLAEFGSLLFVLNSAAGSNVTAFHVDDYGLIDPTYDGSAFLSSANAGGSSLAVSTNGAYLAACERGNNKLDLFPISHGQLGTPTIKPSSGTGAFALTVTKSGFLLAAEAGSGSVSSYKIEANGTLSEVTSSLPTGFSTTCWIIAAADGKHAYAGNPGSSKIAEIEVAANGALSIVGSAATAPGAAPLDLGLSDDGRYLYALTAAAGTITVFGVAPNGSVTTLGARSAAPAASGQNGLAAY